MKKLLSLLLALVLCMGALVACGKDGTKEGTGEEEGLSPTHGLVYTPTEDGTAFVVTGMGTAKGTDIVISPTYDGKPVVAIAKSAFVSQKALTSVTLPESVTRIEANAFSGCAALASVTLSEGLTAIGDYAFAGCASLTAITLPATLTQMGTGTFSRCAALPAIELPVGVTGIAKYAFLGCKQLASVTIPASVTRIEGSAFSACAALTAIRYGGTLAAWEAIEKGYVWDNGTGAYIVEATDGSAAKQ